MLKHFTIKSNASCEFLLDTLYQVKKVPSISVFLKVSIIDTELCQMLFASMEIIILFFSFIH